MIKAGTSAEPAAAAAVLDPGTSIPRPDTFDLFLKAIGAGSRAPRGAARRAISRSAWARSAEPFPAAAGGRGAADGRRRLRHRALPALLRSELRRAAARPRARSSTAAAPRPTCSCASRSRSSACRCVAATDDGSLGAPRPRHRAARGLPRHAPGARCASTPAAPTRCCTRWRAWPSGAALPAQVSLDPWMGCGVGTCLGCVVRDPASAGRGGRSYRCACTEGPVFDARDGRAGTANASRRRDAAARAGAVVSAVPRDRSLRPTERRAASRPEEPADRRLGHLRLRRRVRGHPRPVACWAASSRRASTSSRATAAPTPRIVETPVGPAERDRPAGRGRARLRARGAAAPRAPTTPRCSSTSAATPSRSTPR